MKRKLDNITETDVKHIQEWLNHQPDKDKIDLCPFMHLDHLPGCKKCNDIFPMRAGRGCCPCQEYPIKYVKKIAHEVVWTKTPDWAKWRI